MLPPLPTTVIGSYPQPDWLVDREMLRSSLPPRVRAKELWRVDEAFLAQAQDDATALAIADQERAGLDIVSDGEIRRESYSNRFATALEGMDIDNPAMVPGRAGGTNAGLASFRENVPPSGILMIEAVMRLAPCLASLEDSSFVE